MRSLRVVRWIRRTPRRFSSPATLALTVVLGMPRRLAAAEKLPASTTFTNTAIASTDPLSGCLHSDSTFCQLVHSQANS